MVLPVRWLFALLGLLVLLLAVGGCTPQRSPGGGSESGIGAASSSQLVVSVEALAAQARAIEQLRVEAAPLLRVVRRGGLVFCKRGVGCVAMPASARRGAPTWRAARPETSAGPSARVAEVTGGLQR